MIKPLPIDKANPEVRAYIYQQLSDLEPLIPKGSAIAITVDEEKAATKSEKPKKYVSIILKTTMGDLVVKSTHKDIYKAINTAKTDLAGQLANLQYWIDENDERKLQIDLMMNHKYLH